MQTVHTLLDVSSAFEINALGYERLCGHFRLGGRLPTLDSWLAEFAVLEEDPGDEGHLKIRA